MNEPMIHILGISGSLRNRSSNTNLLRAAAALAPKHINLTIFDRLGDLPHFNPEIDGEEAPEAVIAFRNQLMSVDGVLISTPEYASGVPGVLKNAIDWTVSSGELYNKPTGVLSASPHPAGGENAHASLLMTLNMLNAHIVSGGTMCIPQISLKMNAAGDITDNDLAKEITAVLHALEKALNTEL
ncbi:NAD(P)H-dependent oxidoreductase [Paenibacillus sp. N3/727]|uniref:NADPH-dependent FMN reductase n=1 Tax=Paenibacillus sp. N3/727 TaxID=2925845 RepID=UPI001F538318|nr:NAD(P)H-dependent oxidoreductase [Paenibacillus sp. N3/727]UNK16389.1 NAD(P)H-dependent oxidoreductase [Paenibacillus sp. N3/727]